MVSSEPGLTFLIGGTSKTKGGEGIFYDDQAGGSISFWIDIDLRDRISYIDYIKAEGGRISNNHRADSTQILILSPRSVPLFDMYCHPQWLEPLCRRLYYKRRERNAKRGDVQDEPWTKKVMLKSKWLEECITTQRFPGAADNWAGCRVGGPLIAGYTETQPIVEVLPSPTYISAVIPSPQGGELHHSSTTVEKPREVQALPTEPGAHLQTTQALVSPSHSNNAHPAAIHTLSDDQMDIDAATTDMVTTNEPEILPSVKHLQTEIVGLEPLRRSGEEGDQSGAPYGASYPSSSPHEHSAVESEWEEEETIEAAPVLGPYRRSSPAAEPTKAAQVDPSTLFDGLRFWVDPAKANRSDLLRRLTGAGGHIATQYKDATHVLISGYVGLSPVLKKHWAQVMKEVTKLGVWFVDVKWAIRSLDKGKRVSESEFMIPGSQTPVSSSSAGKVGSEGKDVKPVFPNQGDVHRGHGGSRILLMTNEEIIDIFDKEKNTIRAWSDKTAARRLAEKYGVYTWSTWCNYVRMYRTRTGRFEYLPRELPESIFNDDDPEEQADIEDNNDNAENESLIRSDETPSPLADASAVPRNGLPSQLQADAVGEPETSAASPKDTNERPIGASTRAHREPLIGSELETVLEETYQHIIQTQKKRINVPHNLQRSTGIKSATEWLKVYKKYHDRVGREKLGDERINEIVEDFKQIAEKNNWPADDATLRLSKKAGVLDLDRWRERWNEVEADRVASDTAAPEQIPPPPPSNSRSARMATADIARVLSDNRVRTMNDSQGVVSADLAREHPAYTASMWGNLISEWTRGVNRFTACGPKWNPSTDSAQPNSTGTVSRTRTSTSPNESAASAKTGDSSSSTRQYSAGPKMETDRIVEIFEKFAPLVQNGMPLTELGKVLTNHHGTYPDVTWAVLFGQWRRSEGRFAEVPQAQDVPTRPPKRASDSESTASSSKRHMNAYSDEEERAMAEYILRRMPEPTRASPKDWGEFALKSTRSPAALAEHYRGHRERIDAIVRDMKGQNDERVRATTDESDDSSVIALSPPADDRDVEYVDMTGVDSD